MRQGTKLRCMLMRQGTKLRCMLMRQRTELRCIASTNGISTICRHSMTALPTYLSTTTSTNAPSWHQKKSLHPQIHIAGCATCKEEEQTPFQRRKVLINNRLAFKRMERYEWWRKQLREAAAHLLDSFRQPFVKNSILYKISVHTPETYSSTLYPNLN